MINLTHPVNRKSPLNKPAAPPIGLSSSNGLLYWLLNLPQHRRGPWRDLNRRALTGVLAGGMQSGSPRGRPGGFGAMYFDGVDDEVQFPVTALGLNVSQTWSICCWLNRQGTGSGEAVILDNSAYYSWPLVVDVADIYISAPGGFTVAKPHGGAIQNKWAHVGITRRNTQVEIYLNGESLGTGTLSGGSLSFFNCFGGTYAGSARFKGLLDDVRMYMGEMNVKSIYKDSRAAHQNTINRIRRFWFGATVAIAPERFTYQADDLANPITAWPDAVNDFDLAPVTGRAPAYSPSYGGGLPAADFDGVNDVMYHDYVNHTLSTAQKGTIAAVLTVDSQVQERTIVSASDTASGSYIAFYIDSSHRPVFQGPTTAVSWPADSIPAGTKCTVTIGTNGSAYFLRVNGIEITPISAYYGDGAWFGDISWDDRLSVGGLWYNPSADWLTWWTYNGRIAEIRLIDDLNPTDDLAGIEAIEDELTAKYADVIPAAGFRSRIAGGLVVASP